MDYKSIIESKYNRKNWQLLLHDIFGSRANLQQQPFHVETSSSLAKNALCLGKITLSDEQTIAVYEVELNDSVDIERNRRGIRDMLASAWRGIHAGAFMFCYRNNESVLRFSYVSESWSFAEDGTYKKESTDTKRFTYLLGEGHRSRTAIQQFEKLRDSSLSLKDITKAFSIEAVGDMFFKEYKKNYEDIIFYVTGKQMVKVANKWEEKQIGEPCEEIMKEFSHFANPEKAVRDYVKKLMGRLVFLQFLQKKGWLGVRANAEWGTGDAEFIQNLFAQTADKDHFVDNVLEALFNDLNSEDEKALPQYRTPYLNGGLFERDAQDETNFPLPGKYMDKLLKFFGSYNFTIDENDPDDAEVGVDPEMLGRIFENLLEDNKDKGAFYTPKEIVSYMCRESLIAYLQTNIEDEAAKEAIRNFVTNHNAKQLGDIVDDIDQRLKDVKICDPAIGSGAFPMGLLKELFQCRSSIEGIDQSTAAEIKKHIIQNNIYGVDIEKGAVDIARLRFWLSLIVDEETPQALPNLDFKIMRGNSLLEQYKGFDLSTIMHTKKKVEGPVQMTFFEDNVDVLRRQVIGLRREYYRETNKLKKKNLRQQMRDIVQQQINTLSYNIDLSGIDIADNSEFFLWHTWFSDVFDNGGFDIVIGNPPYVQLQSNGGLLANMYEKCGYSSFAKTGDIYCLFYEIGNELLKKAGVSCYITSNKWMRAAYGEKLRNYFGKNVNPLILIDFAGLKIFENATVDTNILLSQKSRNKGKTISCTISSLAEGGLSTLEDYVRKESSCLKFDEGSNWIILTPKESRIKNKIEANRKKLGETCIVLSRGVGTGLDDAYCLSDEEMKDLLSQCVSVEELERTKKIIHPLLRGRDIKRFFYDWKKIWMIYIPLHFPLEEDSSIKGVSERAEILFQKDYPAVYNHLLKYKDKLLARDKKETGIRYEWYCIQRPRYEKFKKLGFQKIIYQELSQGSPFTVDKKGTYLLSNSAYFIVSDKCLFLTGILNSSLIEYCFSRFYCTKLGTSGIRWLAQNIVNIPIPSATSDQMQSVSSLVEQVIETKRFDPSADTSTLEYEIDQIVYQLYGLTEEEIKIVEGQ